MSRFVTPEAAARHTLIYDIMVVGRVLDMYKGGCLQVHMALDTPPPPPPIFLCAST